MKLLEGQVRIPSGCAVSAVISREGRRMSGQAVVDSMKPMHDRSNGLGGGFAGYGIYPEYRDYFAFHLFFQDHSTRRACEAFLKERFDIVLAEEIPVEKMPQITDEPLIWRYFASPCAPPCGPCRWMKRSSWCAPLCASIRRSPGRMCSPVAKHGRFQGRGLPRRHRQVLPSGRVPGLLLDCPRPLSHQHPGLVGRRPSLRPAGLFRSP